MPNFKSFGQALYALALTRPAYARHCGAYRVRKTKAKPATIPAATMMKQADALGVRRV
jgi:hypothetical protein